MECGEQARILITKRISVQSLRAGSVDSLPYGALSAVPAGGIGGCHSQQPVLQPDPGVDRARVRPDHGSGLGPGRADRRGALHFCLRGGAGPHRVGPQLFDRVPGAGCRAQCPRRGVRQPAGQEPDLSRPAAHRRHHGAHHQRRAPAQLHVQPRREPDPGLRDGGGRADRDHRRAADRAAAGARHLPGAAGDHGLALQPPAQPGEPGPARAVRRRQRRADGSHRRDRGRQGQRPGTGGAVQVRAGCEPVPRLLRQAGRDPGLLPADAGLQLRLGGGLPAFAAAVAGGHDQPGHGDRLHGPDGHPALPDLHFDLLLQPDPVGPRQRGAHPGDDQRRDRAGRERSRSSPARSWARSSSKTSASGTMARPC